MTSRSKRSLIRDLLSGRQLERPHASRRIPTLGDGRDFPWEQRTIARALRGRRTFSTRFSTQPAVSARSRRNRPDSTASPQRSALIEAKATPAAASAGRDSERGGAADEPMEVASQPSRPRCRWKLCCGTVCGCVRSPRKRCLGVSFHAAELYSYSFSSVKRARPCRQAGMSCFAAR